MYAWKVWEMLCWSGGKFGWHLHSVLMNFEVCGYRWNRRIGWPHRSLEPYSIPREKKSFESAGSIQFSLNYDIQYITRRWRKTSRAIP